MKTDENGFRKCALSVRRSLRFWLLLLAVMVLHSSSPMQIGLVGGLAEEGGGGNPPAFSPCPRMVFTSDLWLTDGQRSWSAAHISSVPVEGGTPLGILTADRGTSLMASDLSPDCVHIVVDGGTYTPSGFQGFLWVARADQPGAVVILSPADYLPTHPKWLPDGQTIIYEAMYDRPHRAELRAVGLNGQNDRFIADLGTSRLSDIGPIPSPDGSKIALMMTDGWNISVPSDLWLVDMGTGQLTRITDNPERFEQFPLFSPDGNLLAYTDLWTDFQQDPPRYEVRIRVKNLTSGEDRVVASHRAGSWTLDLNNFRTLWNAAGTEFLALLGTGVVGEEELVETTLYRIPADGSGPIPVIQHPGCQIYSPGWTVLDGSPAIRYQLLCLDQPVRVFVVRPDGTQNQEIRFTVANEELRLALFHR